MQIKNYLGLYIVLSANNKKHCSLQSAPRKRKIRICARHQTPKILSSQSSGVIWGWRGGYSPPL